MRFLLALVAALLPVAVLAQQPIPGCQFRGVDYSPLANEVFNFTDSVTHSQYFLQLCGPLRTPLMCTSWVGSMACEVSNGGYSTIGIWSDNLPWSLISDDLPGTGVQYRSVHSGGGCYNGTAWIDIFSDVQLYCDVEAAEPKLTFLQPVLCGYQWQISTVLACHVGDAAVDKVGAAHVRSRPSRAPVQEEEAEAAVVNVDTVSTTIGSIPGCQFLGVDFSSLANTIFTYNATYPTRIDYYLQLCRTLQRPSGCADWSAMACYLDSSYNSIGQWSTSNPWSYINPQMPGVGVQMLATSNQGMCYNGTSMNPRFTRTQLYCSPRQGQLYVQPLAGGCGWQFMLATPLACLEGKWRLGDEQLMPSLGYAPLQDSHHRGDDAQQIDLVSLA